MSHIAREKTKLLNRVRRIRGQLDAVERALETESDCGQILQLLAGARGAMNGLMGEVIKDHILEHVANPAINDEAERAEGAAQLIEVVRTYLK